jgi:hypothetical protein
MVILSLLENYRFAVGGGHSSARVSEALQKGLVPGFREFIETCKIHAMVAMNELGVEHTNLPAYTMLFAVANPVVAALIANPHTFPIGVAAANSPMLAAGWMGSTTPDPNGGFSPETARYVKEKHGIDVGERSQSQNLRALDAHISDDAHKKK